MESPQNGTSPSSEHENLIDEKVFATFHINEGAHGLAVESGSLAPGGMLTVGSTSSFTSSALEPTSSDNQVVAGSSNGVIYNETGGNSKEKWLQCKSQIQGLNKFLEGSLFKLKSSADIKRNNAQLVELWEEANARCNGLRAEVERLRKNEVHREQLKIIKIELNKLYSDNYETARANQELRMKNAELVVKIASLERRMQLLLVQTKEKAEVQNLYAVELKRELQQSKATISSLQADYKRHFEFSSGLEAEIANYKMLLSKLNQNQALFISSGNGGSISKQVVTSYTTTSQQTNTDGEVHRSGYTSQMVIGGAVVNDNQEESHLILKNGNETGGQNYQSQFITLSSGTKRGADQDQ